MSLFGLESWKQAYPLSIREQRVEEQHAYQPSGSDRLRSDLGCRRWTQDRGLPCSGGNSKAESSYSLGEGTGEQTELEASLRWKRWELVPESCEGAGDKADIAASAAGSWDQ